MIDSPAGVPDCGALCTTRSWKRDGANNTDPHKGQRDLDLAGRLHDEASQLLSLASMQLDMALHADAHAHAEQVRQALLTARRLVRDALAEVRTVISDVQARHVRHAMAYVDLRTELCAMVASLGEKSGRSIAYREVFGSEQGELKATSAQASNALLDAARELVTNACKHTQQGEIELTLSWDACGLAISVLDNGPGLSNQAAPAFGLQLLHRRTAAIGAHVSFLSSQQSGLQVRIYLPWA